MPAQSNLTIVITTYNSEKTLFVLINSIQSYLKEKKIKIIICDDCSTDNTVEYILRIKPLYNITLIENTSNKGVSYSRNICLAAVNTPYVLFLDADIRLHPTTIDQLKHIQNKHNADLVQAIYSATALDQQNLFSKYYALFIHHSFIENGLAPYKDCVFNGWCCLAKTAVLKSVRGHSAVAKGIEIENETLGRKIITEQYALVTCPQIAVDHFWGGGRKLLYIFTVRVFWWVKTFLGTNYTFEKSLTNPKYAFGSIAALTTLCLLIFSVLNFPLYLFTLITGGFFFLTYAKFYAYTLQHHKDILIPTIVLSWFFAALSGAAAAYSLIHEIITRILTRESTLRRYIPSE